jgi:DNA-binding transcriptional LysR family regulator
MVSIRQCRAVLAIADHGSFASAARGLHLAPSAISMQVTGLEQSLGVALFDRSVRPPRLTDAGRIVVAHARKLVAENDAMLDDLAVAAKSSAALRIGVIPTVLTNLLPAALMILREKRRAPTVTVISALSGDLKWAVERGEIDAALIHEPGEIREGYSWKEVTRHEIVAIAPPDTNEIDIGALFARHPYIRFNRAAWVAPLIEARLAEMGIEPKVSAELQSIDAIRLLVGLGFGVSIVPAVGASAAQTGAGPVRSLQFGDPPLFRRIGFFMQSALAARHVARVLVGAFDEAALMENGTPSLDKPGSISSGSRRRQPSVPVR